MAQQHVQLDATLFSLEACPREQVQAQGDRRGVQREQRVAKAKSLVGPQGDLGPEIDSGRSRRTPRTAPSAGDYWRRKASSASAPHPVPDASGTPARTPVRGRSRGASRPRPAARRASRPAASSRRSPWRIARPDDAGPTLRTRFGVLPEATAETGFRQISLPRPPFLGCTHTSTSVPLAKRGAYVTSAQLPFLDTSGMPRGLGARREIVYYVRDGRLRPLSRGQRGEHPVLLPPVSDDVLKGMPYARCGAGRGGGRRRGHRCPPRARWRGGGIRRPPPSA